MPADGPPLRADEAIAYDDDGYNPALSRDDRDRLQVQYERVRQEAQLHADRVRQLLDVVTAISQAYGEDSDQSRDARTHLTLALQDVDKSVTQLDNVRRQLLRAVSPPAASGALHLDGQARTSSARHVCNLCRTPCPVPTWTAVYATLC